MDTARYHWPILQRLGTDLANRVRSFLVIGMDGEGLLATTDDGQAFWFGELRFASYEFRTSNDQPTPLNILDIIGMAQCETHILLLNKRGEIYSMGRNECGQLGLGTADEETHFLPQLISNSQHRFTSVRCGFSHSVALTEDGKCWAWGSNHFGQAGVPSSTDFIPSSHQISELNSHRIVAVECGGCHSLALTDQGEVYAWGLNYWGQLGNGSKSSTHIPTRIPTPSPVQSMAAGARHTLLLTQTGEVWACGWNKFGQLGLPKTIKSRTRLNKVADLPSISQIASHPNNNLSVAMSFDDNRCFIWGEMINEEDKCIKISKPLQLSLDYTTVESPFSFYSFYCNTPYSVFIPETPPNRLSVRMSRMFDNPETSPDVQFVVEQRTIHAHRIILSNSSDYFARMFSERWPVDPEDPILKVTIPDRSYQIFHTFLRFLYTDCLEVYPDLLPEMFELASQYLVPDLQQLCLIRMRSSLTPTNCCLYYPLTHRLSQLPELATFQQELVQFASTRISEVVNSVAIHTMEPDLRYKLTNAAQNFPST